MVLSLKYCDLLNEQFCSAISSGKALLSKLVSFALVCAISFHSTVTVLPVGPRLVHTLSKPAIWWSRCQSLLGFCWA